MIRPKWFPFSSNSTNQRLLRFWLLFNWGMILLNLLSSYEGWAFFLGTALSSKALGALSRLVFKVVVGYRGYKYKVITAPDLLVLCFLLTRSGKEECRCNYKESVIFGCSGTGILFY